MGAEEKGDGASNIQVVLIVTQVAADTLLFLVKLTKETSCCFQLVTCIHVAAATEPRVTHANKQVGARPSAYIVVLMPLVSILHSHLSRGSEGL